jgi:hypothetical protein
MLTPTRKPTTAVRPSAAEKGGSEVSLDYYTTQHAQAHYKPSAVEKGLPSFLSFSPFTIFSSSFPIVPHFRPSSNTPEGVGE